MEPILQFFTYEGVPLEARETVHYIRVAAERIVASLPRNPERTVALRKLLEAKDAAVHAALYKEAGQ